MPKIIPVPPREQLERLYAGELLSLKEVGEQYGASVSTVQRWLRAAGIHVRTKGEARLVAKRPVHSEETLVGMRERAAYARTKLTAESHKSQRQKMIGRTPPNKGKKISEETRALLISQRSTPEYRKMMSDRFRGENSPNWKGGTKSEFDRRLDTSEWRRIRQEVYVRDNWNCQDCGTRCLNFRDSRAHPKRRIQAHHIIRRRDGGGDELSNLVTLCMSCHHKRERLCDSRLFA